MSRITEAKQKLLDYIDKLEITTGEYGNYDILLNLLENADDALFVKIIEEVMNGNLELNDFRPWVLTSISTLENSIVNQKKLYNEINMLRQQYEKTSDTYNGNMLYNNKDNTKLLEKQNILYGMIQNIEETDPLVSLYKMHALKKMFSDDPEESEEFVDSMLLSIKDFTIPVDFEHLELNEYDRSFARQNGISENQLKKMKSLRVFLENLEN